MSDADAPPPERDAFTPPPSRQRPAYVRPRRPARRRAPRPPRPRPHWNAPPAAPPATPLEQLGGRLLSAVSTIAGRVALLAAGGVIVFLLLGRGDNGVQLLGGGDNGAPSAAADTAADAELSGTQRLCGEMHDMATAVIARPYFHLLPAQARWSYEIGAEVERKQFIYNCTHNLPDYAAAVAEHARMSEEIERMDRIWRDNQNEDAAADGAY